MMSAGDFRQSACRRIGRTNSSAVLLVSGVDLLFLFVKERDVQLRHLGRKSTMPGS